MAKKLRTSSTERTPQIVVLRMPIHIRFNSLRQVEIVEGDAPYKISTNERITKLILKRLGGNKAQPIHCTDPP